MNEYMYIILTPLTRSIIFTPKNQCHRQIKRLKDRENYPTRARKHLCSEYSKLRRRWQLGSYKLFYRIAAKESERLLCDGHAL